MKTHRPTTITFEQIESLADPPGTASAKRTQAMIRSLENWLQRPKTQQPQLTPSQRQKIQRWIQLLIRRALNQSQAKLFKSERYTLPTTQITEPPYPLVVNLIPVKQPDGTYQVLIRYPDIPLRLQRREIRQAKGPLEFDLLPIHQIPVNLESLKKLEIQLAACENRDTLEARTIRRRIRQIKDMLGITR